MDELFELVELLKQIGDEAAEAPPPQPRSGEEEGEARVDCHYYEVVYE
ncbi:MAG: hypothetical protein QXK63_01370 [Thermoproteus sp.]